MTTVIAKPNGLLFNQVAGQADSIASKLPYQPEEILDNGHFNTDSRFLEVAPYTEQSHLLDLSTVDLQSQLFAIALTHLKPKTDAYAVTNYEDAFNWSEIMSHLQKLIENEEIKWNKREFYVVEFRSKLKTNIDRELLFALDKQSHREATESGGLLKYWYGSPDSTRRNLATCLWHSKEDAIAGGKGPWHKRARAAIGAMYEEINVKGLRLRIEDDINEWSFEPFS